MTADTIKNNLFGYHKLFVFVCVKVPFYYLEDLHYDLTVLAN